MKKTVIAAAAVVLAGSFGSAVAAGDAAAGKTKAFTCMGCHGIPSYHNVYPSYHVPKLGGQHANYIAAALQAYKSGQRRHSTMRAQAASLSEQDMQDLAAFFAQSGN